MIDCGSKPHWTVKLPSFYVLFNLCLYLCPIKTLSQDKNSIKINRKGHENATKVIDNLFEI